MKNLLPTPAKSHYTFNLRDFSRVIQGCLLLKKQSLENKHTLIRLFVHEVFRVFYDRLVDDKDRAWLFELMHTIVKNSFDESFEKVFEHLKQGSKVSQDFTAFASVFILWQPACDVRRALSRKEIAFIFVKHCHSVAGGGRPAESSVW